MPTVSRANVARVQGITVFPELLASCWPRSLESLKSWAGPKPGHGDWPKVPDPPRLQHTVPRSYETTPKPPRPGPRSRLQSSGAAARLRKMSLACMYRPGSQPAALFAMTGQPQPSLKSWSTPRPRNHKHLSQRISSSSQRVHSPHP